MKTDCSSLLWKTELVVKRNKYKRIKIKRIMERKEKMEKKKWRYITRKIERQ